MKNKIIELLNNKMSSNLDINQISKYLEEDKEDVLKELTNLEEEGIIYKDKNDKYMLLSKTSLKVGIIKVTSRKGPIVVLDSSKEYDLVYNSHSKVLHNDIVLVEPYSKSNKAQLVKVIKRVYKDYVGEIVKDRSKYIIKSSSHEDIILKEAYSLGTRVLIDGKTNTIKEEIGHKDDPNIKAKEILLLNNFPITFSSEYEKELERIPSNLDEEIINNSKRNGIIDLRNIPLVTIDGSDTKDFDDAVAFVDDTLYISIAEVPLYIKENSAMWNETLKRGISVYPPGCVNPMTHHKLSNGICSLVPEEDRFAITLIAKVDASGKVLSYRLCESIIRSNKRMTYEEVNEYLENNNLLEGYEKYKDMLESLSDISLKVKNKMLNEGFLDFSSVEIKFIFDEYKKVSGIKKRNHGRAEDLIEFLMLLHNLTCTNYFVKHNLPFCARNHDEPNQNKMDKWNDLLKQRGYKTVKVKEYNSSAIKERMKLYRGMEDEIILDQLAIRGQSKAVYSAFNKGHFAIGALAYLTSSSPIRRLSDFINQYVYLDSIHYGDKYARDKWNKLMPDLAKIATDSERRADKVENTMVKINTSEYYTKFIGNTYEGYISEIDNGFIRILLDNMVVGKVLISNREYTISKDKLSLINNMTGERFLVGDKVKLKLLKTDITNGEMIFSLINENVRRCSYNGKEEKGKKKVKSR